MRLNISIWLASLCEWPHNQSGLRSWSYRRGTYPPCQSTEEKGLATLGAILPSGGPALYSSLSISFDFICSIELFTLSSESVSLPYLFSNLWALVQTLADLYFKCLLHSERISLQQSWWLCTISFQNFFLCTCGDLWLFRYANYWTQVMMFLLLRICVTLSKNTAYVH